MARRGFYEEYQREKLNEGYQRDRPAVIHRGAGNLIVTFLHKLLAAVIYLTITALSSVGLTTLINQPLRDLLFDLARKVFFGD